MYRKIVNFPITLAITFLLWTNHQSHAQEEESIYKKCSERDERHCTQSDQKFHFCTSVSPGDWKTRLFGLQPTKLFCECREGFNIPFESAYEDNTMPSTTCVSCQEENVVYFGFNIPGFDPLVSTITIDDCRDKCYSTPSCNFWAFNRVAQKCYLKSRRGRPTEDVRYVSGLKNCTGPRYFLEREDMSNSFPLVEMFHPTGERSVIQGVPATFGPRIADEFSVLGYLSSTFAEDTFCENFAPDYKRKGEIALVRRGRCTFLQKTQVAQLAGFRAVIILDDFSAANFERIIYSPEDSIKASFVKIPTVFLRKRESQLFENLIATGIKFLIRMSGSDNFSSLHGRPDDVRFPDEVNHSADHFDNSIVATTVNRTTDNKMASFGSPLGNLLGNSVDRLRDVDITSSAASNDGEEDGGFSPVAIVFIAATAGLIALAILSVGGIVLRKIYLRRSQSSRVEPSSGNGARCQTSAAAMEAANTTGSSSTIFQTVSSGNTGSLEALARWIGNDNFSAAGSDSAEMAVILSSVECPICYEAIWPPKKIYQCTKGHILCETCLGNAYFDQRCPSCRESFTMTKPSRNLALENLFSSVLQLAQMAESRGASVETEVTTDNNTPEIVLAPSAPRTAAAGSRSLDPSSAYSPSAPALDQLF